MRIAATDLDPATLPETLTALRMCGLTVFGTLDGPREARYPSCRFLIGGDALPPRCEREFLLVGVSIHKRTGSCSVMTQILGRLERPAGSA